MFAPVLKRTSARVATASVLTLAAVSAIHAATPLVTAQPPSSDPLVARYDLDPAGAPTVPEAAMAQLLRDKVKYVFVIFNENQSFDHEYGTFPGVNGIYSDGQGLRDPADTPGFFQRYVDSTGTAHTVTPFLLGPGENANVVDSVDHSHTGLAFKLDLQGGIPRMGGFSQDEYNGKAGPAVTQASDARGKQYANIVMSHIDCDTIPFFWMYANRFTIFDNIFATEDTPSTPNAVAMIAGQSGETQWVKHGSAGTTGPLAGTINGRDYGGRGTTQGVPIVNDPNPYWGSQFDLGRPPREPTSPTDIYGKSNASTNPPTYNIAPNLTFATVPLTLGGSGLRDLLSGDRNPAQNQADIQNDVAAITRQGAAPVGWRWYQNGYGLEPTDTDGVASHANFIAHHEGPQYFGYIADNSNERSNLRGEGDFFTDIAAGNLPKDGGVIYIRGGFNNLQGLRSPIGNRQYPTSSQATGGLTRADVDAVQTAKAGDDDHPSYSDRFISEAATARVINAIAADPALWAQSAIIITYDESDGFYDHVPPRILSYGPDGLPLSRGIRVPLLVISPYARTHAVSHAEGDHNAVIETINAIFTLPALSSLPDEAAALEAGNSPAFNQYCPAGFQQRYLGPRDTNSAVTDSLLSAFDTRRLRGTAPPLPASYATIPASTVTTLPHYAFEGCRAIGVTPVSPKTLSSAPPANFNPLASTLSKYNIPAPD